MSIDPFTHLAPDQTVRVLPRHLAGPGPLDLRTVWPFPFDKDWSLHQSPEGAASATSPCLRLWTSFVPEPDSPHQGKWTIAANSVPFGPQAWRITADASTPAELLHDLHTELLDLYSEDHNSDRDRLFAPDQDDTTPQEVYTPLLVKGWGHTVTELVTNSTIMQWLTACDDAHLAPAKLHMRICLEGIGLPG
ncbi:SPDY domain-containing protein [Streptomyces sp. DB-54]